MSTVSDDELAELEGYTIPIYRYENPINRDHFIWTDLDVSTEFSDFNFSDYRFDAFVANVISNLGYESLLADIPGIEDYILPVYHGYHRDMKHNYFSKVCFAWH